MMKTIEFFDLGKLNNKNSTELISEMDENVKRMSKLVEEDGDSLPKKGEVYSEKRPELVGLVQEFYRMYNHIRGEIGRNIPYDIQSQGSCISEVGSELPSPCHSPDQPPSRRGSGDKSSSLDFESESDASYVVNDDDQEVQLRGAKDNLGIHQEDSSECSSAGSGNGTIEVARPNNTTTYKGELKDVKENLRLSEDVDKLTTQLSMCKLMNILVHPQEEHHRTVRGLDLHEFTDRIGVPQKALPLEEELRTVKSKLHDSEKEVAGLREELQITQTSQLVLQDQLISTNADATSLQGKLDRAESEVSKLHDRITRYKSNLSDSGQEIRRLKEVITIANKNLSAENQQPQEHITKLHKERSHLENNLKELDMRCQSLEEDLRRALAEKEEMKTSREAEIELLKLTVAEKYYEVEELTKSLAAITRNHNMLEAEKTKLGGKVEELTAEMSSKDDRIDAMCQQLHQFHMDQVKLMSETEGERKMAEELRSRGKELETKIKQQQGIIQEGAEEKQEAIRQLCFSLDYYRNGYLRLHTVLVNHMRSPVS